MPKKNPTSKAKIELKNLTNKKYLFIQYTNKNTEEKYFICNIEDFYSIRRFIDEDKRERLIIQFKYEEKYNTINIDVTDTIFRFLNGNEAKSVIQKLK